MLCQPLLSVLKAAGGAQGNQGRTKLHSPLVLRRRVSCARLVRLPPKLVAMLMRLPPSVGQTKPRMPNDWGYHRRSNGDALRNGPRKHIRLDRLFQRIVAVRLAWHLHPCCLARDVQSAVPPPGDHHLWPRLHPSLRRRGRPWIRRPVQRMVRVLRLHAGREFVEVRSHTASLSTFIHTAVYTS
jgi:hypothetical protein